MNNILDGTWFNELGSVMELDVQNNLITGKYKSKVGKAKGWYELAGRTDTNQDGGQSLAFSVSWENDEGGRSGASTAWCGQYYIDQNGEDRLTTIWILTEETAPGDDWKASLIGKDFFQRTEPASAQIGIARTRQASPKGSARGAGNAAKRRVQRPK